EIGGLSVDEQTKIHRANKKNRQYVQLIKDITPDELLNGSVEFLTEAKKRNIKTALGSASKNAGLILDGLRIAPLFDVVVDGNCISRAKPDPEVFTYAAKQLGVSPVKCIVFEDALAGVQAAHAAGMKCVGIGKSVNLPIADIICNGLYELNQDELPIQLGFTKEV
ncbi:MAG: HAD-IA family hydrolase, partial [Oscillospiraceae bacterium]|nr:HAD-IA family hydrolase [Oscillospiraceae bacterium]